MTVSKPIVCYALCVMQTSFSSWLGIDDGPICCGRWVSKGILIQDTCVSCTCTLGAEFDVIVTTNLTYDGFFWAQLYCADNLDLDLPTSLTAHLFIPDVGNVCASLYSGDLQWYRCIIVSASDGKVGSDAPFLCIQGVLLFFVVFFSLLWGIWTLAIWKNER